MLSAVLLCWSSQCSPELQFYRLENSCLFSFHSGRLVKLCFINRSKNRFRWSLCAAKWDVCEILDFWNCNLTVPLSSCMSVRQSNNGSRWCEVRKTMTVVLYQCSRGNPMFCLITSINRKNWCRYLIWKTLPKFVEPYVPHHLLSKHFCVPDVPVLYCRIIGSSVNRNADAKTQITLI